MIFAAAKQPKFEAVWLNIVMTNMLLLCVIIEFNGTTFFGYDENFFSIQKFQPAPSFLFRVLGTFILFAFVSLLNGSPRWALKVHLRQDADLGLRLGAITLPAFCMLSHHSFYWQAFTTSLLGSMSLLYNKAPLNRLHWLFTVPAIACLLVFLEAFGLHGLTQSFPHPILLLPLSSGLSYWFFLRFGLRRLEKTFTFGEAHVAAQLISLGFSQVVRASILRQTDLVEALVLALTVGMLLIGSFSWQFLSSRIALLGLSRASCFYIFFLVFVGALIQPWIYGVTSVANPWVVVVKFVLSQTAHYLLFAYWAVLLVLILFVLDVQNWAKSFPLIIVRKFYHLIVLMMFIPGLFFAQ